MNSYVRRRTNLKRCTFTGYCPAKLAAVTWILATYKGLPWMAVIVGIVLILYNFMLTQTQFGLSIYAIGGNTEAAELSGIDVTKVTFIWDQNNGGDLAE